MSSDSGKELEDKIKKEYLAEAKKSIDIIEEELKSYAQLKNKRFLFFVLPFKDLKKLKDQFSEVIKNDKSINI